MPTHQTWILTAHVAGHYWSVRGRDCSFLHDSTEKPQYGSESARGDSTDVSLLKCMVCMGVSIEGNMCALKPLSVK
jgi:hypothetical protein